MGIPDLKTALASIPRTEHRMVLEEFAAIEMELAQYEEWCFVGSISLTALKTGVLRLMVQDTRPLMPLRELWAVAVVAGVGYGWNPMEVFHGDATKILASFTVTTPLTPLFDGLTPEKRDRLYSIYEDADHLFFDPSEALEEWLDRHDEEELPPTIFEYSVVPPIAHLPSVETLLTWVAEWTAENDLAADDDVTTDPCFVSESRVVASALLRTIAAAFTWRQADQVVARLPVTANPDDPKNPLINGVPAWKSVS